MIRGNIELVTPESVQGWIYTEDLKIREKVLLAFWADRCVGSGRVNVFRNDLANAGLGDGFLGFHFPIAVRQDAVGSVVIRLEGSDAVLLQAGSHVESRSSTATALDHAAVNRRLAGLKWSLKHCRIAQSDFDFLRILWSFGVYERSLLRRNDGGEVQVEAPLAAAATLLESYLHMDAELSTIEGVTPGGFQSELAKIARNPQLAPVVALTSKTRGVVRILEGTHIEGHSASGAQRVDYGVSPENLIVIDSRVTAELVLPPDKSLDLITATTVA